MDKQTPRLGDRLALLLLKMRKGFFKMTMREKILAMLFAFALVFVWFTWQLDRQKFLSTKHSEARIVENSQKNWLDEEANTRATYEAQKAQIDLDSLPSRDEVSGQIDSLVRRSGFSFALRDPRTEQGAEMNFHTFQVDLERVSYSQIKTFTNMVKAELPYLTLERVVIEAQAQDDSLLKVRYDFKSIEYTK